MSSILKDIIAQFKNPNQNIEATDCIITELSKSDAK